MKRVDSAAWPQSLTRNAAANFNGLCEAGPESGFPIPKSAAPSPQAGGNSDSNQRDIMGQPLSKSKNQQPCSVHWIGHSSTATDRDTAVEDSYVANGHDECPNTAAARNASICHD